MKIHVKALHEDIFLESPYEPLQLPFPQATLYIDLDKDESCELLTGSDRITFQNSRNEYKINLTKEHKKSIKLCKERDSIILTFSCVDLAVPDEVLRSFLQFTSSLQILPEREDGTFLVTDFFSAITEGKITLARIQEPLTGYNDELLLREIHSTIQQKVRAICSKPKQGLKSESCIQDVSMVKRINADTLVNLASHTEHWKMRTLTGLIPKRLQTDILEDDIDIYENLFFRMAIRDIQRYVKNQIDRLTHVISQHEDVINFEDVSQYFTTGGFNRSELLGKILPKFDILKFQDSNEKYKSELKRWQTVYESIVPILDSSFYKKISKKKRISRNIHVTNILKNDSRYRALYLLWIKIRKSQVVEQDQEGASDDIHGNIQSYYFTYTTLSLLYAMDLLGIHFSSSSVFSIDDEGLIDVQATGTDPYGQFTYSIYRTTTWYKRPVVAIDFEEVLDIPKAIPAECQLDLSKINKLSRVVTFDEQYNTLHFHDIPNDEEKKSLREVIPKETYNTGKYKSKNKKINTSTVKNLTSFDYWQKFLDEVLYSNSLRKPHQKTIYVCPLAYSIPPNMENINSTISEILYAGEEPTCYTFPIDWNGYKDIHNERVLSKLYNYGNSFFERDADEWKNYHKSVLPIRQNDLLSVFRLRKFITIQRALFTLDIEENQPKHCPVCGSTQIQNQGETHSWKCENLECGVMWKKARCTDGCKNYFYWTEDDAKIPANLLDEDEPYKRINKKDIVFDNHIITDFEYSEEYGIIHPYPICPICGTRRKINNKSKEQ